MGRDFQSRIHVIDIESSDAAMVNAIVTLRKTANLKLPALKLPDAIIAAAALGNGAALITEDQDFQSVKGLTVLGIKA